jgi:demethylspheroidene O-methyltransferase
VRSRSAVGTTPVPMLDRWFAWRDRLLASARFQRWAAAFPLTRPVARRRVRALFDLCAGFVYSQVLYACVRLQLFDLLRSGPATPRVLSPYLGLSVDATERLLAAAAALGLVERRPLGRFGLGPLGAAMADQPAIAALVEHHAKLYADLADPVGLLRGDVGDTALGGYWPYARSAGHACSCENAAPYSRLMSLSQSMIADEVLDAVSLASHRCLLDVGGGEGAFLAAVARRMPHPRLQLFELPAVAARAEARLGVAGLAGRVEVVRGNFHEDPLPIGADVISLVRVLHDHDDAAAMTLLRAVRRALPRGGKLLLAEPMAETPGAEPAGDAYFGFYLLAMGSGRPRSAKCLKEMLENVGFSQVRHRPTRLPLLVRVLTANA